MLFRLAGRVTVLRAYQTKGSVSVHRNAHGDFYRTEILSVSQPLHKHVTPVDPGIHNHTISELATHGVVDIAHLGFYQSVAVTLAV